MSNVVEFRPRRREPDVVRLDLLLLEMDRRHQEVARDINRALWSGAATMLLAGTAFLMLVIGAMVTK